MRQTARYPVDLPIFHVSEPHKALEAHWEKQMAFERTATPPGTPAPRFGYSAGYEVPFDRVEDACAVPFRDLPFALQELIAPRVTNAWYVRAMVREPVVEFSPAVRTLVASTWKRRTMPVRDLADHVMTEWAIHHAWPAIDWKFGYLDTLPPKEYRGGYTRLVKQQRADQPEGQVNERDEPPVIFLDGEIHKNAISYAAALLRFAPSGTVRVLEGTSGPADPLILPAVLRHEWCADGLSLRAPSDWSDPGLMPSGFDDQNRGVFEGRAEILQPMREAFGLPDPAIPHAEQVTDHARNTTDPRYFMFVRGRSDVSLKARRAWRAHQREPRGFQKFRLRLSRLGEKCWDFLFDLLPSTRRAKRAATTPMTSAASTMLEGRS